MNSVILGFGKVGETIIENLLKEKQNVCVVDTSEKSVENAINKYDVQGVVGNGISREIMLTAGANKADFFIACTSRDEVNIVSCVLAKKLGAKYTIARIREPEYVTENIREDFGIDLAFNPEYRTAKEILKIIKFPSADRVETFASGKLTMAEFSIYLDNPMIGKSLMEIVQENQSKVIFGMVSREDELFIPKGDFVIKAGDVVSVLANESEITSFSKKLHIFKQPVRSVCLIGGGKISYYLANELILSGIKVKIIENNEEKCNELSRMLPNATVILGDGTDTELLKEEHLEREDACILLTDCDEENAMISLFAKNIKVDKVITKVDRPSMIRMIDNLGLDSIISPRIVVANYIVRFIRAKQEETGAGLNRLYKLSDKAEALEFTVTDSFPTNVAIKDLKIKKDILIGGIVRESEYVLPVGNTVLKVGDRVTVIAPASNITSLAQILK